MHASRYVKLGQERDQYLKRWSVSTNLLLPLSTHTVICLTHFYILHTCTNRCEILKQKSEEVKKQVKQATLLISSTITITINLTFTLSPSAPHTRCVTLTLDGLAHLHIKFTQIPEFVTILNNSKQSAKQMTSAQQTKTKQLSGKHARKRIRAAGMHEKGVAILDASTAISLFSPGVKGAYVNRHGYCFAGKWTDIGPRPAADLINHMVDAMHHLAKSFCPNDPLGLVQAVFSRRGPPGSTLTKEQDYEQWSKTAIVKQMKDEYRYPTHTHTVAKLFVLCLLRTYSNS